MRVVLDTNVLVAGLITPVGACARIVQLMFEGLIEPCVDSRILNEYGTVLQRPLFQIPRNDVADVLELINSVAEEITAIPLSVELPDPHDLPFLEVAAQSQAILVTGNIRHFPKKAQAGVRVVSPRELLDLLQVRLVAFDDRVEIKAVFPIESINRQLCTSV